MVALTGIEWVKCQFSSVRLSLSRSFSVLASRDWIPESPHNLLWCDPRVTAGVSRRFSSLFTACSPEPANLDANRWQIPGCIDAANRPCL